MRNPNTRKWDADVSLNGLLLFAQAVEEMLFDYTLDSYKLPVMNTHRLAAELFQLVQKALAGTVAARSVLPVLDELRASIKVDIALGALLGTRTETLLKDLTAIQKTGDQSDANEGADDKASLPDKHLRSLSRSVAYLVEACRDGAYLKALTGQLAIAVSDPNRKKDILALTQSLIVELLASGYSRHYVFFLTKQFFFESGSPANIVSPDQFRNFMAKFNLSAKRWDVIAKVTRTFWGVRQAASDIGIVLQDTAPAPRRGILRELDFLTPSPTYPIFGVYTGVEALDPYAARIRVEDIVRSFGALCKQYAHRDIFDLAGEMVVYDQQNNQCTVLAEAVPPLLKAPNRLLADAHVRRSIEIAVKAPGQFFRTLELHATALENRAPETQFLTLWTALEGFLPESPDESRIENIVNLLEPVLSRQYASKLLGDFERNLRACCPAVLGSVLAQVPEGTTDFEKLAAVVSIDAHRPLRVQLYTALGRNVLLINRLNLLKESLDCPKNLHAAIQNHWRRVRWHLHRMYRTRNLLVHSARTVDYLEALAENLHAYLDILMETVSDTLTSQPQLRTIPAILNHVALDYRSYQEFLAKQMKDNVAIDSSNFRRILGL